MWYLCVCVSGGGGGGGELKGRCRGGEEEKNGCVLERWIVGVGVGVGGGVEEV